ncbi:MAG TPA: hypothetical protein VNC50_22645, partial [Planctomycetia bacterium]|nr:hypothetical protein [Planctomycetia bacterium]
MSRAEFPTFSVDLPPGWGDITPEVEADDAPPTVARDDGVGALQFSIGLYESGPRPRGDIEELQELLDGFAESHGLTSPSNTTREYSPRCLVAASFQPGDEFLRAWYFSEGGNFAFVTYTCGRRNFEARELLEAEKT